VSVSVIGARSADGLRLTNVSDVFTPDASKGVVRPHIFSKAYLHVPASPAKSPARHPYLVPLH
jgi:hypothetical protein